MKIVLDTNCLLRILPGNSKYHYVDCALNAGADFIITNDKHFNILKDINFPKMNVIDIDTFMKYSAPFNR